MPRKNKVTTRAELTRTIAGITKRFPASRVFRTNGEEYTRAEMVAVFQAHLDALDAVDAAHAAFRGAVANERKIGEATREVAWAFQLGIKVEFGVDSAMFADFGWQVPKKPGPKTTTSKVAGVEKRAAKRKVRS